MRDRRKQLRDLYGFDFPDDLFRFWEFAQRLRPLDPLNVLEDLSLRLVGPFEVLAGRFDDRSPRLSFLLHWRYYLDPPEFFTVLAGGGDGFHVGYFLDAPPEGPNCLASYYAQEAYELSADGDDLFEAVRLHLEYAYNDCEIDRGFVPEHAQECEAVMRQLDRLRSALFRVASTERVETGEAYTDKYAGLAARNEQVIAETQDGLGVVVAEDSYRPLSSSDKKLWRYLWETDDPADLFEEARRALCEGYPGTALKLGKDLWAVGGERHTEYAYELLDGAYAALGREVLREVLRVHRANRELPSVDILENEA